LSGDAAHKIALQNVTSFPGRPSKPQSLGQLLSLHFFAISRKRNCPVVGHTANTFGAGRISTLPIKRTALRQLEIMDPLVAPVTNDHWYGEAKNGLSMLGPLSEKSWKLKECCHRWIYHTPNSILGEEHGFASG